MDLKHLLIVYHSHTGNTEAMANAAVEGAREFADEVECRLLNAFDAGLEDLLWADGLLLGTPENFGYMSGGLKDFLDRTYYPAEGKVNGLPYAIFISAGNDGSGALFNIQRIAKGYSFKEVAEAVIAKGDLLPEHLQQCRELGQMLAAGISMGIF